MSAILTDKVLVLNKNWMPIEETTVAVAFCDIVRGVATAIDTEIMRAVTWAEWAKLSIREGDHSIATVRGPVRVPTVICKASFDRMPEKTPKLSKRNRRRAIGERDGKVCQITGVHAPDGNVDHWVPRSKGGKNTYDNLIWTDRKINALKGDMTPEEFTRKTGLKLLKKPKAPTRQRACLLIKPRADKPDWDNFLLRK
jgi:5-methylcytosine-specific restriction endonuclease McrA